MIQDDKKQKVFEDFAGAGGRADIFGKALELDSYFREHKYPQDYGKALGIRMLGPAARKPEIEEADGRRHETIMLGSNSYLNLTTHPAVVAASKAA